MYIATREINTSKQTYQAGQEVQNPSTRMIEVGAVRRVPVGYFDVANEMSEQRTGKDKRGKAQPVKAQAVKAQPVKEPVKETQEEILTEDSADVEVKTEE